MRSESVIILRRTRSRTMMAARGLSLTARHMGREEKRLCLTRRPIRRQRIGLLLLREKGTEVGCIKEYSTRPEEDPGRTGEEVLENLAQDRTGSDNEPKRRKHRRTEHEIRRRLTGRRRTYQMIWHKIRRQQRAEDGDIILQSTIS